MTGTTSFINLNFGIGPMDLLVGYRMWRTKFKEKYVGTQKTTDTCLPYHSLCNVSHTESVNRSSPERIMDFNQITAGIGFGF